MKSFFNSFSFILILLLNSACNNDYINNWVQTEHLPMWSQPGHDGRRTGNISAINNTKPVSSGVIDWTHDFPAGYYDDGGQFCIDSKGCIYYLSQLSNNGSIYKFRSDGSVIWKIDTVNSPNYASISLNADETRIYFSAYRRNSNQQLWCYDSTGIFKWSLTEVTNQKPLIGKSGTIYVDYGGVKAVNPDGTLKWLKNYSFTTISEWALDNDENVYTGGGTVAKFSKDGNLLWTYRPEGNAGFNAMGIVIDYNNNIYFGEANQYLLYSLTKDGIFRWKDSATCRYIPAITKDNIIISGGKSVTAFDTSGIKLWSKNPIHGNDVYSITLDGEGNSYFISSSSPTIFEAMDKNGNSLWSSVNIPLASLPLLALSPQGRILFGPKRAYTIYCFK